MTMNLATAIAREHTIAEALEALKKVRDLLEDAEELDELESVQLELLGELQTHVATAGSRASRLHRLLERDVERVRQIGAGAAAAVAEES